MKNLLWVIYAPEKVFEEEQKPWTPLIVGLLISILFFIAIQIFLKQEILSSALERIAELPEEQQSRALKILYSPRRVIIGSASILIVYPIKIALLALIYNIAAPILGGELPYFKAFTIFSFSRYISSLSAIIKLPVAILTRNPFVRTDLGIFFSDKTSYIANVASQVDLFTIWSLVVAAIGLEKYAKMKRENAIALVGILWLAYIFVVHPLMMIRRLR